MMKLDFVFFQTMDLLLTELSASLIEDMKDLDEEERKVF